MKIQAKRRRDGLTAAALLLLCACCCAAAPVSSSIDWASFLSRSDMVWAWNTSTGARWRPTGWYSAAFLGNGNLGMQVLTGDPPSPAPGPGFHAEPALRFEIGRADVTDDRVPGSQFYSGNLKCDRERLSIGSLQWGTKGAVSHGGMRLSLWDAELTATVNTSLGSIHARAITHAVADVNIIRFSASGGEVDLEDPCSGLGWHPVQGDALVAWQHQISNYTHNPPISTVRATPRLVQTTQRLHSQNAYASAVLVVPSSATCTVFQSTQRGMPRNQSLQAAVAAVHAAAAAGLDALLETHRGFWHGYYPASFVSLSNTRLESFYWVQMYKGAAGTRGSVAAPSYGSFDHHGPWFAPTATTCCILFNWDMNLQVTYWPWPAANRPGQSNALSHLLSAPTSMSAYKQNTPAAWRNDSLAGPEGHSSYWALNDPYLNPDWHPDPHGRSPEGSNTTHAPSYTANLLWALQVAWKDYSFNNDEAVRGELLPVLEGHMNLHLHMLLPKEDGRLHLPPSWSPEYNEKVLDTPGTGDTTYHLALVRWGLETLLADCETHTCDPVAQARWQKALDRLAPFSVDSTGALQVAAGLPFTVSHRHFSHLFPCFPLGLLNSTDPICAESADRWYRAAMHGPWAYPNTTGDWCLWSMAVLSSLNTLIGRPDDAWSNITHAVHQLVHPGMTPFGASLMPNTMYSEGCLLGRGPDACTDPTGETPFALASAIQDALVTFDRAANSVRVFAGVPSSLSETSFENLRTQGGFLVSGSIQAGRVSFVNVSASAGSPRLLRVFTGLQPPVEVEPFGSLVRVHSDGSLTVQFGPGLATVMMRDSRMVPAVVQPVEPELEYLNWWGFAEGRSAGGGVES